MTQQGETTSGEDFSLLRVVNFLLRYRQPLVALPLLGFLLAAGAAKLQDGRTYTAEALVQVPRTDSARTAYEELFRSAEVLSAVREGAPTEWRGDLHPEALREQLQVSRSGTLVRLSLSVPSESLSTIGLGRAIDTANAIYDARSLPSESWSGADSAEIAETREALVELENRVATALQEYASVRLDSGFARPASLPSLAGRSETALEAAAQFEFAAHQSELTRIRTRLKESLVKTARSGAIDEARARSEMHAARDSVRRWLGRQGRDQLSASERFRYETLLWRVELWQDVLGAMEGPDEPSLQPVVVAEPTVTSVASSGPIQSGILGALAGGLLAFVWGLIRESIRRGEELRSAAYREFRDLVSSTRALSWKGMRWLRGESSQD